MIVIHPTEGLCNRLRVVFSYYQKALENNEELAVIWDVTAQCNGFFLDCFEPVEHITFVLNNDQGYQVDYKGYQWCEGYSPYKDHLERNIYQALVPLPYLRNAIAGRISTLEEKYIAVHIRRTDHSVLARENNRYTEDSEFHEFIKKNEPRDLYLATDNYKTQDDFLKRYSERIKCIKMVRRKSGIATMLSRLGSLLKFSRPAQEREKSSRNTSVEDAVIDLFVCIYADKFMGSGYSSFSNFITYMRKHLNDTPAQPHST